MEILSFYLTITLGHGADRSERKDGTFWLSDKGLFYSVHGSSSA